MKFASSLLSDAQSSRVARSIVLSRGAKNEVLSSDGLTLLIKLALLYFSYSISFVVDSVVKLFQFRY